MRTRNFERSIGFFGSILLMVAGLVSAWPSSVSAEDLPPLNRYGVRSWNPYAVERRWENGKLIEVVVVPPCPPPENFRGEAVELPASNVALGINSISEMPAFNWCYGCSATSAAMAMGHFDRIGYPNMYAGPSNGGVCPLNNETFWPNAGPGLGECPLSVTHMGIDGRTIRGHVDDYWIAKDNPGPDPYIVNGWAEHIQGDCTGDYMGTNQSKFTNTDGSTYFAYYINGDPLHDYPDTAGHRDGCHGMRLFVESRGYSVTTNYTQFIQGYPETDPGNGFTFADFQSEIDAGYPVLIQVVGHTMLGFGYDSSSNTIYIRDTWDHLDHTMTWGGSYADRAHYAVAVCRISGAAPGPASPVRVYPDRTSFSNAADEMSIYAYTDAIPTPCYPFVRIVTPYYGTFYLTAHLVMYRNPVPYVKHPIVIGQPISGMYLTSLRWRNVRPGTYYLEGGAVDARTGGFLGSVHTTALTLN